MTNECSWLEYVSNNDLFVETVCECFLFMAVRTAAIYSTLYSFYTSSGPTSILYRTLYFNALVGS